MQYNDKIIFTRSSNFVIENWRKGVNYTLHNPHEQAFLVVEATIRTSGTLIINGMSAGVTISESIPFIESGIQLSENAFESILTLTPSWTSYNITIRAEDKQGQPVESSTSYGPFPACISDKASESQKDGVSIPGWGKGQWLIGYIESFQPQIKDAVVTMKGWHGRVQDVIPASQVNYPKGWQFLIVVN
jgi:hypothetical protein